MVEPLEYICDQKNKCYIYIFLNRKLFFDLVLFHSTTTLIHDEDIGSIFWIRMTEPICKLSINETKQTKQRLLSKYQAIKAQ